MTRCSHVVLASVLLAFVASTVCWGEDGPGGSNAPSTEKKEGAEKKPQPPAETPKAPQAKPQEKTMPPSPNPALSKPELATEKAPAKFKVKMSTTKGDFVIEVTRDWAPNGADRFYNLVKIGYFTDVAFFRVIEGFMAQFGIHGDPAISAKWRSANITDDPVRESNQKGYLSFATAGPNTRTTQLFINLVNNKRLDGMGFSPIGKVVEGMDIVETLFSEYGEGAPSGRGPDQGRVQKQGNTYLKASFPNLDYIKSATIVP